MATHSSILAWEMPWTKEPGGLQSTGSQKSQTQLSTTEQKGMKYRHVTMWVKLENTVPSARSWIQKAPRCTIPFVGVLPLIRNI